MWCHGPKALETKGSVHVFCVFPFWTLVKTRGIGNKERQEPRNFALEVFPGLKAQELDTSECLKDQTGSHGSSGCFV